MWGLRLKCVFGGIGFQGLCGISARGVIQQCAGFRAGTIEYDFRE